MTKSVAGREPSSEHRSFARLKVLWLETNRSRICILCFIVQISYVAYISSSSLLLLVISTEGLVPKTYRAAPRGESRSVEIANIITANNFQPLVQLSQAARALSLSLRR